MKNKIAIISTGRADFSYLEPIAKILSRSNRFDSEFILVGSHNDVAIHLESQTPIKMTKISHGWKHESNSVASNLSNTLVATSDYLKLNHFDLVLILGDRYEALGVMMAASLNRIPIAHIAGGDTSLGSYDEVFRNAMTQFANLHFPTNAISASKLVRFGVPKRRIAIVGAASLDRILETEVLSKEELERRLNCNLEKKFIMVTLHPETMSGQLSIGIAKNFLDAISSRTDITIVFTSSNADHGGNEINSLIKSYVKNSSNAYFFTNLGPDLYINLMKNCAAVVGNSSSGIYEAPFLGVPVLNIGSRQKGRTMPKSILNVDNNVECIRAGIEKLLNLSHLPASNNMFGNGNAAKLIIQILESFESFQFLLEPTKLSKGTSFLWNNS